MSERNTRIRASQIINILPSDLDATVALGTGMDNYIPSYDQATGKFTWVPNASGASNLSELNDVEFVTGTPTDGQVLTYDTGSGKWIASNPSGGALNLFELEDVSFPTGTPVEGQILKYNGSEWIAELIRADNIARDAIALQLPVQSKSYWYPPEPAYYWTEGDRYLVSENIYEADILSYDGSDISDWTDEDNINGESIQTTFDSQSCFKFDTKTAGANNRARRFKSFPSSPTVSNIYTVETRIYIAKGLASGDETNNLVLKIDLPVTNWPGRGFRFLLVPNGTGNDGLYIWKWGQGYTAITGVTVEEDTWITWRFQIYSDPASYCDIYKDDVLIVENLYGRNAPSGSLSGVTIELQGTTENDLISYVDFIEIGTGFKTTLDNWIEGNIVEFFGSGGTWIPTWYRYVPNGSWSEYTPEDGWLLFIKDINEWHYYNGINWKYISTKIENGTDSIEASGGGRLSFKIAGVDQIYLDDGVLRPTTHNDVDLGSSSYKFKDGYFAGKLDVDGVIDPSALAMTPQGSNPISGLKGIFIESGTNDLKYWDGTTLLTLGAGITEENVDDFTIKYNAGIIKVADRIELNTMLLAFRLAESDAMTKHSMIDGMEDVFEDETGVDTVNSLNETYNSGNDYYQPPPETLLEMDYCEYSSNSLAQTAWPTSSPVGKDDYVKLLLHGNENLGDKSIIDSGNTRHVVSQNGGATLFTGAFGASSAYFDGSGDYLSIPNHADFRFGTGDFTIDFWAISDSQCCWYSMNPDASGGIAIYQISSVLYVKIGTTNVISASLSHTSNGGWHHIAVTRSGTSVRLFVNGIQYGSTGTDSQNINGTGTIYIGMWGGSPGGYDLTGYLNEFRVSNTARWTANFNPPSSEYTSDSNTKLLLHLVSNFTDVGNTVHSVTATGDTSFRGGKFGNAGLNVTASGAYLSTLDHTDWDFGTGNWTVECWLNPHITLAGTDIVISIGGYTAGMEMYLSDGKLGFWFVNNSITKGTTTLVKGTWYHLAIVRTGNNIKCFVNGTQEGTDWNATGVSMTVSSGVNVGNRAGSNQTEAFIDEVRISNTARYTTTFTPSTSEFTSDSNTKLLLHCNTVDSSTSPLPISTAGDAHIESYGKFENAGKFNGTSSYLSIPDHANWDILTQTNFTIDFWIKSLNKTTTPYILQQYEDLNNRWGLYYAFGSGFRFFVLSGGTLIVDTGFGGNITDSAWHHIAVCKVSNEYAIYKDGVQINYVSDSDTDTFAGTLYIGMSYPTVGNFDGYLDEVRITHNNAFSASPVDLSVTGATPDTITVPTEAYLSDTNTKLLLHLNGNVKDFGNTGHTVTNSNMTYTAYNTLKFSQAGYFDGTASYLSVPDHDDWTFGTENFTIDFWIYPFTDLNSGEIVLMGQAVTLSNEWTIQTYNSGYIMFWYYPGSLTVTVASSSAYAWEAYNWYHIAVIRGWGGNANDYAICINGTAIGTVTDSDSLSNISSALQIGHGWGNQGGNPYFKGLFDEVRISKGIARWTTTFTPSSSPYTSDSYTKLLLHLNGNVTDSGNTVHTVTNNSMTYAYAPPSNDSYYAFDGSGDYLRSALPHGDFEIGTRDFTIDCWLYIKSISTWNTICYIGDGSDAGAIIVYFSSSAIRLYVLSSSYIDRSYSFVTNQWYHLAIVRTSGTVKIFIDGTQVGADWSNSGNIAGLTKGITIGVASDYSTYPLNGYIDEFRFSKGIARWTTTFTPSTQEYVAGNLQDYSEATIKQQGSYSLKAIANTSSLNDYIRKTVSKNLSSYESIKFDIRASREGTNLQLRIHDSGGTISTKDIEIGTGEADTWKTITWDISGISSADRDAIDYIELKVTNADAENTIYLDNIYAYINSQNMTLISNEYNAEATPDGSRLILWEEDVDSITVNTDIKAYVSRDGGSTWAEITLADEGNYDNNKRILTGTVDLTATGLGTATGNPMKWKVTTHNTKQLYLHAVGMTWD